MGHRKHSAPRRGSLAFLPRARARSMEAALRTWPIVKSDKPTLLGFAGFKAGCTHVITVDDREKTPNFGKPMFNPSTVLSTPPLFVCGFRAYGRKCGMRRALFDVYSKNLPSELQRKVKIKANNEEQALQVLSESLQDMKEFRALVCARPRSAGLAQKKPFLFEVAVGGGDLKAQFEYLKSLLGKEVKIADIFKPGMYVDAVAITKGKGFEGPVTRMGVKRKQHKSRKSVRAVAVIGPWHPAAVMYTVPRAGQMGFHQRTDISKRILAVGSTEDSPITPPGDFLHYGVVKGDYMVVKGSVPGSSGRLVKLRYAMRKPASKLQAPKILEVASVASK